MRNRYDETWHRLREWTKGQTQSERLAAQILINQDFLDVDPSHPLGGRDGGKDALAKKDGKRFAMAVYFPRGQKPIQNIGKKFRADLKAARGNSIDGFAFVTNQELTLGQRETLRKSTKTIVIELYHLERITTILDSPPMAKVREQFLEIAAENAPPVIAHGGEGGKAPGAGGGGGSAIGTGARAGRGGDGGNSYHFGPDPMPLDSVERILQQITESTDVSPGAGGRGASAVGENAVAGDGGGGGDHVRVAGIKTEPGDFLDFEVGEGGKVPSLPGQHAKSGGDTVVRLRSKDGTIKGTIRVKGGVGAKSGELPEGVAAISQADLDGGFEISTLMLASSLEFRGGLMSILSGGWGKYNVPQLPIETIWPYLCTASWRALDSTVARGLQLCLLDPQRIEVSRLALVLPVAAFGGTNYHWPGTIGAPLNSEGSWTLRVQSGNFVLSEIVVNVSLPPQNGPLPA